MSKFNKSVIIGLAIVLLAGLGALASFTNNNQENNVMEKNRVIPPIDASPAAKTEIADFAFG